MLESLQFKKLLTVAFSVCALAFGTNAAAQPKVTRLVIPYPPGGGSDFVARVILEKFQANLGGSIVIENKAGANGGIGAQVVERSAPDGLTLMLCGTAVAVVNPFIYQNLPYDPINNLIPVSRLTMGASAVFIPPNHPANNVSEYIAWAKARGKPVTFGSAGVGGTSHVLLEVFGTATGLKVQHVPYRGSGPAATDVMGGQIDATISDIAPMMSLVKAGRLKMLGLVGSKRHSSVPDLPTFAEQGYPAMNGETWYVVMAPAKTPPVVVRQISEALRKTMDDPGVKGQFSQNVMETAYLGPEASMQMMRTEAEWWGKVVKQYGIRGE